MRHYHGTPIGGRVEYVARFVNHHPRFFLIPHSDMRDLPVVAQGAAGFVLDCGSYSAWRRGEPIDDWGPYYETVSKWSRHPAFDWACIPDVIEGSPEANDELIREWDRRFAAEPHTEGVPVWHYDEPLERLERFVRTRKRVGLGSTGAWPPGSERWWRRTHEVMSVACDEEGRPRCKLHGFKMLSPAIIERLPLESADSTNVAQNHSLITRFGIYKPPSSAQRAETIAARIEQAKAPPVWVPAAADQSFFEWYEPALAAEESAADE